MDGIQHNVVVITGAGNGIGQATALLFSGEAARVVVVDIDEAGGNETVNLITRQGGQAMFVRADVSRDDEVKTMIERVVQTYGHINILFANAAIQLSKSVVETEEQEWDRIQAVNLKGVFLCCKHVVPVMQRQKKGAIVISLLRARQRDLSELLCLCSHQGCVGGIHAWCGARLCFRWDSCQLRAAGNDRYAAGTRLHH
jgi:NAD(P)-dependent dehydrogenase (short-subunit alcohol dehydrogenase family)